MGTAVNANLSHHGLLVVSICDAPKLNLFDSPTAWLSKPGVYIRTWIVSEMAIYQQLSEQTRSLF